MKNNDKNLNGSIYFAAVVAVITIAIDFIQRLVGFDKNNLAATPKTFQEAVAEWPRFLGIGLVFFLGALWWRLSQKDKETFICSCCQEPIEKEIKSELKTEFTCQKCGGKMEHIEGYYDSHSDRR